MTPLPRMRKWMRARIVILTAGLLTGAGFVVHRAYELQVKDGGELRRMAEEQYLRDIRLSPKRGTIYDRNGAELAVSVDVDSVWANPREVRRAGLDPGRAAADLAAILGVEGARIAERLRSDRHFVWIKRRVTPQEAAAVRALNLQGISLMGESRRFYPGRELAAQLLGFSDVDGIGLEGIEREYDAHLRGAVHAVPAIRDRSGTVVFSEQLLDDRASQGDDVHLTIDKTIQHAAERELALAVHTFEAVAGNAVVLDPRTGEILAMANYPTFNPNDPGRAPPTQRRNRTVTDRFEPGSTVKPFTVAAALGAGTIGAEQAIDCENGRMRVLEYTVHDTIPYGSLTPAEVLAFSSNIGASKIGRTLGRRGLFRAFRRFGFGEKSGVDLPGEAAGILRHYRNWYEMDAATIPFGQGMSVTTLQLASAMAALANDGKLMRPTLVRRVTSASGDTLEEHLPVVRRRVISADVARLVADMITAVTGPGGGGIQASIDGYLVAGKTGTAQKADYVAGGYARDRWMSSFVGFAPVNDPRVVIAVAIDEPMIAHLGGQVAAPVFRRVGEVALRRLGVPPSTASDTMFAASRREPDAPAQDARTLRQASPPAAVAERTDDAVIVPSVIGMNAREAVIRLVRAEQLVSIEGEGVVTAQDPEPGAPALPGATVRLTLAPFRREPAAVEPETALAANEPSVPAQEAPAP